MKKIFLVLSCIGTLAFVSCKDDASAKIKAENVEMAAERDEASKAVPVMTFEQTEFDFGNIPQGAPVQTTFKFTNTGKSPLVITNASSSCGCTVPEYSQNKPIAPGESGEIVVKYNASGKNEITKTVTLVTNTAKGAEQLKIKAFVESNEAN